MLLGPIEYRISKFKIHYWIFELLTAERVSTDEKHQDNLHSSPLADLSFANVGNLFGGQGSAGLTRATS